MSQRHLERRKEAASSNKKMFVSFSDYFCVRCTCVYTVHAYMMCECVYVHTNALAYVMSTRVVVIKSEQIYTFERKTNIKKNLSAGFNTDELN